MKGVVDSSYLPSMSREMLQDDAVIRKIKSSRSPGGALSTLAMMADERNRHRLFHRLSAACSKRGCITTYENADKLKALMMFRRPRATATR